MDMENTDFIKSVLKNLSKTEYIKPDEIPNIDLYMDQVTTFMEAHLGDAKRFEDDKILTKTMINNYAKNDLLPPPIKKKYSKEHIIALIFIYYYKNILSIKDIKKLINPLTDNFFEGKGATSFDAIYKEIYRLEKAQLLNISKDVTSKSEIASSAFENVKNSKDRDYLQLFAFISLLSFDIVLKKHIIESIIDDLLSDKTATVEKTTEKAPKEAPKEKAKKKDKK